MLLTWTNGEYTWKCILKRLSNFSLCAVCNYSYFCRSGGINFPCRLIMLAVEEEWILCQIGGLWVFTRCGGSKALFNWENESITAAALCQRRPCEMSKWFNVDNLWPDGWLIEGLFSWWKNIKCGLMQVDTLKTSKVKRSSTIHSIFY